MAHDNLIPMNKRTKEEQSRIAKMGGIASGKVRQEKKKMKELLEMMLETKNDKGITYGELATLGLIKGAIQGNARNYETIVTMLGEAPNNELIDKEEKTLQIEIVDNSNLEEFMYK